MNPARTEIGANLVELADRLSDVLAAETALLQAFELREAGGMLPRKRAAVAALQDAVPPQGGDLPPAATEAPDALRASLHRLGVEVEANRVAIEQGLAAQLQVMEAIARAVPRARAGDAPVYRPDGSRTPPRPPDAYAFLSRM